MDFFIRRYKFLSDRTLGEFIIGNSNFGWILEDKIRPDGEYIFGETAIPAGEYRMIITYSNRFKRQMIQLVNKRGNNILFGGRPIDGCGVRIHGGNLPGDTEGCPLLGANHDDVAGKVWNCATVVEQLTSMVEVLCKTQEVYLTITDDYGTLDNKNS